MSRRVALPTEDEIRVALARLVPSEGPPTVVALARSLGLANATFWRHFPEIAQEVADARRCRPVSAADAGDAAMDGGSNGDRAAIDHLRTEKAHLGEQLEAAVAHIRRLTLENRSLTRENQALREEVELAAKVTRIPRT